MFDLYLPLLKPKNRLFFNETNLNPNLALKLAPNENYFTEDLVGIL